MYKNKKRICVCGLGKLGASIAAVFDNADFSVVGLDSNIETIDTINKKKSPIKEPKTDELFANARLLATNDYSYAAVNSDACIFVLPTPSLPNGTFDNSYLIHAITRLANCVAKLKKQDYLFIITSTVVPGTCDKVFLSIIQSEIPAKLNPGLAYKPEFIALGTVVDNLNWPDVVLIGEQNYAVGLEVEDIYSHTTHNTIVK